MMDKSGRTIHKLRLNLLDACNMRCLYCMPKDQKFKKTSELLSPIQMKDIVAKILLQGVDEVRLTGGEPLLHPKFKEIVSELSTLGIKKLGLTTNAISLEKHLPFLKEHGVHNINISFDSLDAKSFEFITHTNKFEEVKRSILMAKKMGFNIKLNCVMLKNINFEEMEQFLEFSAEHDIEVRFLELMKIGYALQYFDRHFVSADDAISKIQKNWDLTKVKMPADSTSFNYQAISKQGKKRNAKVGFIASETKPFCGDCSRLRLSSEGTLRPCIMINEGPNLIDVKAENYQYILSELIEKKPLDRLYGNHLQMNEVGG